MVMAIEGMKQRSCRRHFLPYELSKVRVLLGLQHQLNLRLPFFMYVEVVGYFNANRFCQSQNPDTLSSIAFRNALVIRGAGKALPDQSSGQSHSLWLVLKTLSTNWGR